jgi:hypothetical protein
VKLELVSGISKAPINFCYIHKITLGLIVTVAYVQRYLNSHEPSDKVSVVIVL